MGDVFLQPMMNNLDKKQDTVSVIFGILPAVTLATGKKLLLSKNCLFLIE